MPNQTGFMSQPAISVRARLKSRFFYDNSCIGDQNKQRHTIRIQIYCESALNKLKPCYSACITTAPLPGLP